MVYPGGAITPGGRDCLSALYAVPAISKSFHDIAGPLSNQIDKIIENLICSMGRE